MIGKDTIVPVEVSPSVVMEGFRAADRFYSGKSSSATATSSSATSTSTSNHDGSDTSSCPASVSVDVLQGLPMPTIPGKFMCSF